MSTIRSQFPDSPWTLIASLKRDDPAGRDEARARICQLYAKPLYAFVERHYPASSAADLTQRTFEEILSTDCLSRADRERGKFRSFLLLILKSVASRDWKREAPHRRALRIDDEACRKFSDSLVVPEYEEPGIQFDRMIARDTLARAFQRVREKYRQRGKERAFGILSKLGMGEAVPGAADLLGISEGALRVQIHRFRLALNEAFRNEVAKLVSDPAEIETEIRYLLKLLNQRGTF